MRPFPHASPWSRSSNDKALCRAGILGLLLWVGAGQCQGPAGRNQATATRPGDTLVQQTWSTDDGLPQNTVHAILQTSDGFLWVATEAGLARFDGLNFRVFQQANQPAFTSDDICCLAEDTVHALWIGTADGLLRESDGRFERFDARSGLPSSTILDIAADADGSVVVLTSAGVARVDARSRIHALQIPGNDSVLAISRSADGRVWLATANDLLIYEHDAVHRQRSLPKPATTIISGIAVTPDQESVWVRSAQQVTLVGKEGQQTWSVGHELPGTRTESISADLHGVVWVGTNRGLVSFDATSGAATPLVPHVLSIVTTSVLSTAEDRDGDRWIGSEAAGLTVLRQQTFHSIPAIVDQAITAVAQTSDGSVWLASREDGLWRVRDGTAEYAAISAKLASHVVLALAPGTHGDLWVGTPDGLNHVDGSSVQTYTSANGLPDDFIRSLLVNADGTLWVGTRRGLVELDGNSGRVLATYTSRDGLRSDAIGALLHPTATAGANDLWIATFDGLSRLRDGHISTFTKADGLSGNVITSLAEDSSGTLWIGTRGDGLTSYSHGVFRAYTQQGLPRDIDSILPDGHGRLWMGTHHGVVQVSTAMLEKCGADAHCSVGVSRYGDPDGLPGEDLSANGHPAAARLANGELWFTTTRGVAITDPARVPQTSTAPPVAIERMLVDDAEMPLAGGEIRIPAGHTRVSIEYAGMNFRAPSRIRFRYMLEGLDGRWTDVGPRRTAYFTSLPPRSYRFLVQAASSDGLWNGPSAELRFSVEPPFYRRWCFYVLALLAALVCGWLLYRLRLRRLQREFNAVLAERNRIAREIHDTLAQDLVGVSLQLEVVVQILAREDIPAARTQIDAARTIVREGLEDARRRIWELRAVSAQDSLPTRLSRVLQRAGERGLRAECTVGGTYRELPQKLEDEILSIAQEAVANALRHAGASAVTADLRYSPGSLILRMEDDGRGFDVAAASSARGHFGLIGMQERATAIAGRLKVESVAGRGTSVMLEVDI